VYPLFELPPTIEENLEKRLAQFGHSLKQPEKLAEQIRKLSNLFLRGVGGENYWREPGFRAAYISYFAVLNYLRCRAVFREARLRGFLNGASAVADWGCGAGSATWALLSEWARPKPPEMTGLDRNTEALDEFKAWMELFEIKSKTQKLELTDLAKVKSDTVIMSYVLNEVAKAPEIPAHVERLVIIEPSTHQAGREMLRFRDKLLESGWHAWAPCTHQKPCPLLVHSGKDWCHHRIHWIKPGWFMDLEKFLPMKNDTLTLSYVLLARAAPRDNLEGIGRVIGDEQEEKGKSRQMICRGPGREFLSWLHRDQISLKLKRGDLIRMENVEPRANELRVHINTQIEKLPDGEK
jgi:ribosomal protein RSM22 (predicted rRNA methylase)